MIRIKKLALACTALVSLAACEKQAVRDILQDVGSFIEECPDSALLVLESIPKESVVRPRTKARHALLYAMALDKNYIDTTYTGIIAPAVDYYARHGSADDLMKAYYYQGVAYYNAKEYDNAMVSMTFAEEQIPKAKDMRYVGLVYSTLSSLCNKVYDLNEELRYAEMAAKTFSENGLEKYKYSTLTLKGRALASLKRYDEAEEIFAEVINEPSVSKSLKNSVKEDYALLLTLRHNHSDEAALSLYREVLSANGSLRNINLWSSYAYSLAACRHKKESRQVFAQLYALDGNKEYSLIDIWKSAAYECEGDYPAALSFLRKSLNYQDSLVNLKLSQATAKARVNYFALKNSQIEVKEKNEQIFFLFVLVFLLFVVAAIYLFYRTRTEKLKKERTKLAEIAESMRKRLQDEIGERDAKMLAIRKEYIEMYRSQFKYLGDLCEAYLLANERRDSQRIVYEKVQEMIKDINGDVAGQQRFEISINSGLNNIMKHFREDFPNYSEADYRFVSYLFAGFDATTISIILGMPSVDAVYMKKSRIKKTILNSEATYKQEYLEIIS